jgi:hypothetical protein
MSKGIRCWCLPLCFIASFIVWGADRIEAEGTTPLNAIVMRDLAEDHPGVTIDSVRQKLGLAQRSLEYVERCEPRPELASELEVLADMIADTDADSDVSSLFEQIRSLRRRIIFSHPDLDFDNLLILKQPPPTVSHMCHQYLGRYQLTGKGLAVLENWKVGPEVRLLLQGKMPPGAYYHPDLSFDGQRILFSFSDHRQETPELRRFWIYECASDGSWVNQLTGTKNDLLRTWGDRQTVLVEDWDPCYLPGGGFVFTSSRCQTFGRCHGEGYVPVFLLHRADPDGGNVRQISFNEANEWNPSLQRDGRILYTRWDYINRHDTLLQGLWTTRPDGADVRHFYGTNTRAPTMLAEARAIPGTGRIVATAAAHHAYTTGSLVTIDPLEGEDGERPITRLTPEAAWPESEGYDQPGTYSSPWPVNEEMYFASYQPDVIGLGPRNNIANVHAIYLVDTLGGRELIYSDPENSCTAPIPLRSRPAPPAIPSMIEPSVVSGSHGSPTGVLFIQDVHAGLKDIAPGTIKAIRINQIHGQPTNIKLNPGFAVNEVIKQILGTVPVNEDGSVCFTVPASQPLQLQALDANGMAVMTMRSVIYSQAGETQSCIGCHEPKGTAPSSHQLAAARQPVEITPPAGPLFDGGFSFVRTVQPVLDRYCIECHGLEKTEGEIDLLGTPRMVQTPTCHRFTQELHWGGREIFGNQAVASLLSQAMFEKGLVSVALRFGETDRSQQKDYFAHAGRLAPMLLLMSAHPIVDDESFEAAQPQLADTHIKKGHEGVEMDQESLQRIIDWLDLNAQISGSYLPNQLEFRTPIVDHENALREHIRITFDDELANQPLAALINYALDTESRILQGPLTVDAGGWGTIDGGWNSTGEPGYQKMHELVQNVLAPLPYHDIQGTCGQEECVCGSCWVREANADYFANSAHSNP